MADRMDIGGSVAPIEREVLLRQKEDLAAQGLRVLASPKAKSQPSPTADTATAIWWISPSSVSPGCRTRCGRRCRRRYATATAPASKWRW